jgi:hypothetical protein
MFLLGGTAFSGKTLLAHMLNQGSVVCLDEPDFHDPRQRHRGIPLLSTLFPGREFPAAPEHGVGFRESVAFIERCEQVIQPVNLGMKTSGPAFLEYAKVYRESGYPVVGVVRDIRDVLAEAPLPEWIESERQLSDEFRSIWTNLHLCDVWFRYEDLVADPEKVLDTLSTLLGVRLELMESWDSKSVHRTMFKLDRHQMLRAGRISRERVGIWRQSGRKFSDEARTTAAMMGYGEGE